MSEYPKNLPDNYVERESGLIVPKSSGIVLPLAAMPGDHDHQGTLGKPARRFLEFMQRAGIRILHDLPFTPPDGFDCPYSSVSTFAIGPQRIDLEELAELGDITSSELEAYQRKVSELGSVERDILPEDAKSYIKSQKEELLKNAAINFENFGSSKRKAEFAEWRHKESDWLDSYASFEILKNLPANKDDEGKEKKWQDWEVGKDYDPKLVADLKVAYEREFTEICYMQWVAEEQTLHYLEFAKQLGIEIWGDIPFYTGACDVWANRPIFNVDAEGNQLDQGGAPPSDTEITGQNWGNATYKITPETVDWWVKRIERTIKMNAGKVRLDHFIGFAEPWLLAADAENGIIGRRGDGIGDLLFAKLREIYGKNLALYPEDLGEKTPLTTGLRDNNKLPSSKVVARGLTKSKTFAEYLESENHPGRFTHNDVAFVSTHDSLTFVDVLRNTQTERPELFCGYVGNLRQWFPEERLDQNTNLEELTKLETRRVMGSGAVVAFMGAWDLSKRGKRYNKPGKVLPENWSWRLNEEDIRELEREVSYWYELNKISGRL